MRRSDEIPFSRSRTWTASTISLDIDSPLQQVASLDTGVRDRDDPGVRRHCHALVVRADQLACEAAPPRLLVVRAHAHAATEEAAVVVRLGQGALGTRRGHLER